MPTVTRVLRQQDSRYPIGTSVGLYPGAARREGQAPCAAALQSQTVAADGSLTFTNVDDQRGAGLPYCTYALVNGQHRYCSISTRQAPDWPH